LTLVILSGEMEKAQQADIERAKMLSEIYE